MTTVKKEEVGNTYRPILKRLFKWFALIGIVLILIGVMLYFGLGPEAGFLKDSTGKATSLRVNLFVMLDVGGIGMIFLLVSLIAFWVIGSKERKIRYLKENGRTIYATNLKVIRNNAVSIGGRHPYQVTAEHKDELTGMVYKYKSDYIKEDPGELGVGMDSVRVFIDRRKNKRYYVDLESIMTINGYKMEK